MAAIAVTAVSLYPTGTGIAETYLGGVHPRQLLMRQLKITGVTAADTATPTVLGFSHIVGVLGAHGATAAEFLVDMDPTANSDTGGITIGAGPSNETIYLTILGVPRTPGV